nr:reverse transcriptase domain-containing protein [Tanacetum cinerariifolium]
CFYDYALILRQDYDVTSSLRRGALHREYQKRHRSRLSRSPRPSPSVFSRIRRDRSRSPRQNSRENEGGMFKRLGDRGKSVSTRSDSRNQRSYSRYTGALSESEDSGGRHWKSRSMKKKSNEEEDDLSQPWVCEEIDPFTPRIRYSDFSKTRMPSHIQTYDGSEDPKDHLKIFHAVAKKERWAMPTWCHMFNSTLMGNVRVWFDDLPTESIDNYDDLKKAFLENYLQQKKCIKVPIELHNIKQRDGESTEEFMRRYKLENRDVKGAPECMRIYGFGEVAASNHERKKSFPPWKQQEEILFPPLDEEEGTEGPMIIEAEIGGHCIHRMYVNDGSALEILYEHCFNRLRLEIKKQLVPAITLLIGFSGEIIWPIGKIQLLVRIGDEEQSASAWMNFVVVRSPSSYNEIIRRPGVRKLQAVLSIAHGILKLLVKGGVITLKSSRMVPLECALVSGPEEILLATEPILKERVNVAINSEYSKQTVMIGSTLTKGGRNKLCGLLQRNLDIFSLKPADMNGVPRHIEEHHLKVREGCSPVRQKKRRQAVDRNQAIHEEDGKLVSGRSVQANEIANRGASHAHRTNGKGKTYRHLAAAKEMVSVVLMTEREAKQMPIYFVTKALREETLPADVEKERAVRHKSQRFAIINGTLYRKSFLGPWLRCVGPLQANYVLREIHEGSCSMHASTRFVVAKALRIGYYWPTMHKDTRSLIRACQDCQVHKSVPRNPQQKLTPITSLWSFYKWGIDIAAKPVATITGNQIKKFVWDNIVGRFGLPGEIISDNRKQFRDNPFKDWCEKICICQHFDSVKHPQTNGLVERTNLSLREVIKARLDTRNLVQNDEALGINLDLLEEKREQAAIREALEKYYNSKVQSESFKPGDLVYRNNDASRAEDAGKLGPKWEGPYEVT